MWPLITRDHWWLRTVQIESDFKPKIENIVDHVLELDKVFNSILIHCGSSSCKQSKKDFFALKVQNSLQSLTLDLTG